MVTCHIPWCGPWGWVKSGPFLRGVRDTGLSRPDRPATHGENGNTLGGSPRGCTSLGLGQALGWHLGFLSASCTHPVPGCSSAALWGPHSCQGPCDAGVVGVTHTCVLVPGREVAPVSAPTQRIPDSWAAWHSLTLPARPQATPRWLPALPPRRPMREACVHSHRASHPCGSSELRPRNLPPSTRHGSSRGCLLCAECGVGRRHQAPVPAVRASGREAAQRSTPPTPWDGSLADSTPAPQSRADRQPGPGWVLGAGPRALHAGSPSGGWLSPAPGHEDLRGHGL